MRRKSGTRLQDLKKSSNETRFRASIYVDIFIPNKNEDIEEEKSLDEMREEARNFAEEAKNLIEGKFNIGYAYVGGVGHNPVGGGLDRPELENL